MSTDTHDMEPESVVQLAARIAAIEQRATPAVAAEEPAMLPDGGAKALSFLVRSTSQRPLTTTEARDKLLAKEHPEDVVDAVVAHAVSLRLLDDAAFAEAWVNDRGVNRGYGRSRLTQELRRRKVAEDIIADALSVLDDHDEVGQATELARARAQRMPATLDPPKVASRLVGFLVRRGFASDIAHQVAREVTRMDRDWD